MWTMFAQDMKYGMEGKPHLLSDIYHHGCLLCCINDRQHVVISSQSRKGLLHFLLALLHHAFSYSFERGGWRGVFRWWQSTTSRQDATRSHTLDLKCSANTTGILINILLPKPRSLNCFCSIL